MWVKRTEKEILAAQTKAKRRRLHGSILAGAVFCAVLTFLPGRGRRQSGYTSLFLPMREIHDYLPVTLSIGIIGGWLFYHFLSKSRKSVICTRCEKTKFEDSETKCSCGGHFEDLETMKWV